MFGFIKKFKTNNVLENTKKEDIKNDFELLEKEIEKFKKSTTRANMINGENYYVGKHNILYRKRLVIGEDGDLEEISNLPNNKIVDNQYRKMVNQKANYLLGKPFSIQCENKQYTKLLKKVFNKKFLRVLRNIGEDSLNNGLGWIYVYYDEYGEINFKGFKPWEVIPIWKDREHNELKEVIRVFQSTIYDGGKEKVVEKVEVYDTTGIKFFEYNKKGKLVKSTTHHKPYILGEHNSFNFNKIPIIPFKYNNKEIPLINNVKSLQDGINLILSNFQNNMEEDARNTILVLVNYDGENLGEFRKNLANYGAVKVKTIDGAGGDIKTLQVEVNSENYKVILGLFKNALIENAMGFDAKDDRLSGNPNQMNILSMYSDIDLDANSMETEFQASFESLLWFVNIHLYNNGFGDFTNEEVDVIFNRDILIKETEVIENCTKSVGILSNETIVANHPWVKDTNEELIRMEKEKDKEIESFNIPFENDTDKNSTNKNGDSYV